MWKVLSSYRESSPGLSVSSTLSYNSSFAFKCEGEVSVWFIEAAHLCDRSSVAFRHASTHTKSLSRAVCTVWLLAWSLTLIRTRPIWGGEGTCFSVMSVTLKLRMYVMPHELISMTVLASRSKASFRFYWKLTFRAFFLFIIITNYICQVLT